MDWILIEAPIQFRLTADDPLTKPVWRVERNGMAFQVDAAFVTAECGDDAEARAAFLESEWMAFVIMHAEADNREWAIAV